MRLTKGNRHHGFTLAELLIVVAIIGVLVAISIPIFTAQLEKAREATDLANIRSAYATVATNAMTTTDSTVTVFTGNTMQSNGPIEKIVSDYCGPWKSSEITITRGAKVAIKGELQSDGSWKWIMEGGATAPAVIVGS